MPETRPIHPKVELIIAAFEAQELHASRSGREVIDALGSVVAETSATTLEGFTPEFTQNVDALANALQAYAPTMNVLHRLYVGYEQALEQHLPLPEFQASITKEVEAYIDWSQQARSRIAAIGKTIILPDSVIYTHTLSETVLRTLLEAKQSGVRYSVLVTESRPNNDGRYTTKSLAEAGIPVEISIDACINELIRRADLVIVGAEAILADGSAICKVGTYPSALVARQHNVPVYILVDSMKFYTNSLLGAGISLDPLHAAEVVDGNVPETPEVRGYLFDRTPAEYITAVVTELGIMHPSQVALHILTMPISEAIVGRRQVI